MYRYKVNRRQRKTNWNANLMMVEHPQKLTLCQSFKIYLTVSIFFSLSKVINFVVASPNTVTIVAIV